MRIHQSLESTPSNAIEFISAPDYETPLDFADNIYEFKLSVTDQGTQVIAVFVEVANVNDQQPVWRTTGEAVFIVSENRNLIDLNATDDFQFIHCFLSRSDISIFNFFDLDPLSGELSLESV